MNSKIIIVRIITAVVILVGGAAIQVGLWKTSDRTYFEALTRYSLLWVVYLLLAFIIGERLHRLKLLRNFVVSRYPWAMLAGLALAASLPKISIAGLAWVAPG